MWPDHKSEFGLAFGDYVEAHNPRAQRNNVTVARTEPCIALYHSANQNGSWMFYNLSTQSYVRRSQWKRLPMSRLIIDKLNKRAGQDLIVEADFPDTVPSLTQYLKRIYISQLSLILADCRRNYVGGRSGVQPEHAGS